MAFGALAQLGEHLLCKQGVNGSIPLCSTIYRLTGDRGCCLIKALTGSLKAPGIGSVAQVVRAHA